MRSKAFAVDAVIGVLSGLIVIVRSMSIAALIFAGALSPFIGSGMTIALLSTAVLSVIVALRSSIVGAITTLQNCTVPIIALAAASVVATIPQNAPPETIFTTAIASIAFISLFTGVFLLVLGHYNLGKLFRYLPYPVIGGFIAGAGLLLIIGAINIMVGFPLDGMHRLPDLLRGSAILQWLPGVGVAVVLFAFRKNQLTALPLVLVAAVVAFHVIWLGTGRSLEEAATGGWLLSIADSTVRLQTFSLAWLSNISPEFMVINLSNALVVAFVAVMTLLLETNSLELQLDRDLSLDRELQTNGLANVAASFVGGIVGFSSLSLTTLAHQMGASTRFVGVIPGLMAGVAVVSGVTYLRLVPTFVLGSVLAFLGLTFVHQWLVESRQTMPRADYAVIVFIAVTITAFGYLTGVGVGLVLAVALFAYKYSQVEVVKNAISGADRQSNVARPPNHLRTLYEHGEQICIFQMQGYIFFGTANKLYDQVWERTQNEHLQPLRYMVLDFHLVTGIDTSASVSFVKLQRLADTHQFTLVFADIPKTLHSQLDRHAHKAITFNDLDYALEYCEDRLLNNHAVTVIQYSLHEELQKAFASPTEVDTFLSYMVKQHVQPGTVLIEQGTPTDRLLLISTAGITAFMKADTGVNVRLQKMERGAVLGEVGFYLDRPATATVVVEHVGDIYYLTHKRLQDLEEEEPEIAAAFHKFMVKRLAGRVSRGNAALRAAVS